MPGTRSITFSNSAPDGPGNPKLRNPLCGTLSTPALDPARSPDGQAGVKSGMVQISAAVVLARPDEGRGAISKAPG